MKLYKHEVSAWTVGDLRKALADYPDDMPIRVAPLEEPGGDLEMPLQVVTGQEVRGRDENSGPDYVALECDFPSGEYPPN